MTFLARELRIGVCKRHGADARAVYEQFYRTVRAVNWARPAGRQIRVLLGDPPIDWAAVTDGSGIGAFPAQREARPASVVEQ
jgi:hypothetical protein